MNQQAEQLNRTINNSSPTVFNLLSGRGRNIYFPKQGILSQSAEANGKKINATIGIAVEDDGSPMRLASITKGINIAPAKAFPYAPSFGRPDLRDKWKAMIYDKNPGLKGTEISLPVVTNALTHGLSMIGYLFLNEGDVILSPDLYWENYELAFDLAYGSRIETFPMFNDRGCDLESFRAVLAGKQNQKISILLNYPNNPAGYTPTKPEVQAIVGIIKAAAERGNRVLAIIDDAYFGLVYEDGVEKESIFTYLANLHENVLAVKLDGATKEDYVWGFRVGFITYGIKNGGKELYAALEAKTGGAVRGNISNAANLSQSLVFDSFASPTYAQEKAEKYAILKTRYEAVKRELSTHPEYTECFRALPYNSGYFMCVKLAPGLDCEQVRKVLLSDFSTGVINMSGILRIAFSAVAAKDIPELFRNLFNACKKAKPGS